ncbi:apolipoprotein N-acyltransferase [candidate division WOR-3 bacterium]|nr:apolipoprotein N-acyltransferase [candidate division WOR-3 bacterium]
MSFPPASLRLLILAAQVPLLLSLYGREKKSFSKGLTAGFVFFSLHLFWITRLPINGHLKLLLFAGYILMCVYLSLYFGIYAYFISKIKNPLFFIVFSSLLWTALEYIRSRSSQVGFPWGMSGYSLAGLPLLIQITSIGGIYLLGIWITAVNSSLAMVLKKKKYSFLVLLAILLANVLFGTIRLSRRTSFQNLRRIAVVQPNISQDLKGSEDEISRERRAEIILDFLSKAVEKQRIDVLVLPETSWPWPVKSLFEDYDPRSEILSDFARAHNTSILVGAQDITVFKDAYRPTNSVFLIDDEGVLAARHDKIYLVPFGEHLPFDDVMPFLTSVDLGQSDYLPGKNESLPETKGMKIGVGICYESAFTQYYRGLVESGAGVVVNLTDDQWFGRSAGPVQHADIFILRVVENNVWGIRCANTGVSYLVDPFGRVVENTGADMPGYIYGTIGTMPSKSFYTHYMKEILAVLSVFASISVILLKAKKRRQDV